MVGHGEGHLLLKDPPRVGVELGGDINATGDGASSMDLRPQLVCLGDLQSAHAEWYMYFTMYRVRQWQGAWTGAEHVSTEGPVLDAPKCSSHIRSTEPKCNTWQMQQCEHDMQCVIKQRLTETMSHATGSVSHSKSMAVCLDEVDEQLLWHDGTIVLESIRSASTQVSHHRSRQSTCSVGCSCRVYPDAICVQVWAGVDMPILTDTIPSVLLHSSTASWQMRLQEHMHPSMHQPHMQHRCT